MLKLLIRTGARLAALLAAFAVPASADTSEPDTQPIESIQIVERAGPALWLVGDEDTTIYLFGTVHALPPGVEWFEGNIANAFAASDSLVTEVVNKDDTAMAGQMIKLAMLHEGANLRDQLSPEQRAAYDKALADLAIPPAMLDRFEPWYAAMALSTLPLMKQGYSPENGVEGQLDKKASARKMPHQGLETVEYQIGLFDGLPADVQQRYLGEVIEQLPTIREDIAAIIAAWKSGDAEELARLMNFGDSDPVFAETLLTGRNKAWAEWIDERMDKPGTVFVAVGAGHLAGKGSVQEQLAKRGIGTARVQ